MDYILVPSEIYETGSAILICGSDEDLEGGEDPRVLAEDWIDKWNFLLSRICQN